MCRKIKTPEKIFFGRFYSIVLQLDVFTLFLNSTNYFTTAVNAIIVTKED